MISYRNRLIPPFDDKIKNEYIKLFNSCIVKIDRIAEIDSIIDVIKKANNIIRYKNLASQLNNIPWYFIAAIHNLESSLNFKTHLHNGDSLDARTVHVPKGRPKIGNPPFTWEQSAEDALKMKGIENWSEWTIPGIMYQLEGYNGWGYRLYHPEVLSPYLWSFSNHYTKGKYTSDGKWSDSAISDQCGGAVLLKRMKVRGIMSKTDF